MKNLLRSSAQRQNERGRGKRQIVADRKLVRQTVRPGQIADVKGEYSGRTVARPNKRIVGKRAHVNRAGLAGQGYKAER